MPAQRTRSPAERHQRIQDGSAARVLDRLRQAAKLSALTAAGEIDDLIADSDTNSRRIAAAFALKHPEGQILNREVGARRIRRLDPASKSRVVRVVNHSGSAVDILTSFTTMLVRMRSTPSTFISFSNRKRSR